MISETLYPWQYQQWTQLSAHRSQGRLPHAVLLTGYSGLGKKHFALQWAKTLLCDKTIEFCGKCHSCLLIQADSHPDLKWIEPEQAEGMIKIDQIRELIQFANETALQGHHRVVLIHPAGRMNIYAANALLKTLEEPAPNTTFILINDQNQRLPATILSRCQKIFFHKPAAEMSLAWLKEVVGDANQQQFPMLLKLTEGAPLQAKESLENGFFALRQDLYQSLMLLSQHQADPLMMAAQYQEYDSRRLLNLMLSWIQDILRHKLTNGEAVLTHVDYQTFFAKLTIPVEKLFYYQDQIKKIYGYILSSLNLNRQLLLEEIFIDWVNLC